MKSRPLVLAALLSIATGWIVAGEAIGNPIGWLQTPDGGMSTPQPVTINNNLFQTGHFGGMRQGLFGSAAVTKLPTWLASPPVSSSAGSVEGVTALLSQSLIGQSAGVFASRTSDNAGGPSASMLPLVVYSVVNSTVSHPSWGLYVESDIVGPAGSDHILQENSIYTQLSPVSRIGPYLDNVAGQTIALRLDCGKGSGTPQDCSTPLHIVDNGAKFADGIIFSSTSIVPRGGFSSAIELPQTYSIDWQKGDGTDAFKLFSSSNTFELRDGTHGVSPIFVNTDGGLYLGESGVAGVAVGAATGGQKGNGTLNVAGAYYANGTVGVSCTVGNLNPVTAVVTNGIITHC